VFLGARSAFRETAKALGVPNERVNTIAKLIPRSLEAPYAENLKVVTGARRVDWREPVLAEALRLAERLDGAPRHLSIHCAGALLSRNFSPSFPPSHAHRRLHAQVAR
jgi:DNA polymerase-3 subunit alpha